MFFDFKINTTPNKTNPQFVSSPCKVIKPLAIYPQEAPRDIQAPLAHRNITLLKENTSCPFTNDIHEVQENETFSGYGIKHYSGLGSYMGNLKEGKRTGEGKMEYINAKMSYEGSWDNDLPHGKGILTIPVHGQLIGQWINGLKEGFGKVLLNQGIVIMAQWKNNYPAKIDHVILPDRTYVNGSEKSSYARYLALFS